MQVWQRWIGGITLALGIASIVLGIILIGNYSTARAKIAESVSPLTLDQIDPQYETAKANVAALAGQQGTLPYTAALAGCTSLGLAKSNLGMASQVMMVGIISIILGAATALCGLALALIAGRQPRAATVKSTG